MTADDRAAGESFQSFFQGAQGIDVEIVGRLVEDDEVKSLRLPFLNSKLFNFLKAYFNSN